MKWTNTKMSAATTLNNEMIPRNNRLPVPVEPPRYSYEQDKWATSRQANVDWIAEHWSQNPFLVRVLTDKKFGSSSMVMLRKDAFERTVKILDDIRHGEILVKTHLDLLFNTINLVTALFDETSAKVPQINDNKPFVLAIQNLTKVTGQVQTVFQYAMPPKPVKASKLTEEELAELEKLEKNK